MRSTIAAVLLLWAVGVVAQEVEVDVVGPPAASELTIAQLSEKVSKELTSQQPQAAGASGVGGRGYRHSGSPG